MIAEQILNLLPYNLQNLTYISELPLDVDNCIALVEYGGAHIYYFKNQMDTPLLKIVVRHNNYEQGYNLIKSYKQILSGYSDGQSLGIVLVEDIMYIGRDNKRRNMFQLTFKIFSYIN